ncbi:MAG: type VII secretion protein EccB [Actinophytocola sp.]|uniref:type VII secretion protein EccB n=1 Tax=Actinophytocola sp. TaxID=1872138 RepID=UPI003C74882D
MPSTPTTKSQVQAYRFVLRRMQSALVRKDSVMLHDPMRTHSRATVVGVCLAALGLLGFLIWGILSPKPKAPTEDGIVIGKPSGQVYVLIAKPDKKLVPVFNMASARLLLMAQQQKSSEGGDSTQAGNQQGAAVPQVVAPTVVDDNELRDIPRGRKAGIADGPDLLPSADQRIESRWTVCDRYILDKDLPDPAKKKDVETTVIAGVEELGPKLQQDQSLLVRAPNGKTYLVYRTPGTANLPDTSAVRAEVDIEDERVSAALELEGVEPRKITTGMLNAIPEKAALKSPPIADRETDSTVDLENEDLRKVGSVFEVERAGDVTRTYVLLKNGIEEIKRSTANLIRYYRNLGGERIAAVSPAVIADDQKLNEVDDATFPERDTEVLDPQNFPVACLAWNYSGEGDNAKEITSVHVGKQLPGIPLDYKNQPMTVPISTPSADHVRIDHFYMPAGRAAVVRQATSPEDFERGQITLISDRGVKYGVPDPNTAAGLGLADQKPAPRSIIQLLPDGASLSVKDVEQSYDSTPVGPGQYPSKNPEAQGGG